MGAVDFHVARGAALEPIWPAGYIGSITHKHSQVAVAVARDTVCRGIGVDIEKIVPAQRVEEIDEICLHSLERNSTARKCLGASLHASLCFSAKEAIYKALYPAAQRFIDYQEAIVEAVDVQRGTWRAQMLTSVSAGVGRGKVFNGTFRHDLNFVYTALIVS